jgi:K+-transporting ATPase ATPase C chain
MRTYFISSLRLTVMLFIILAGIYPFLVMAIGKLAKDQGKGVTIERQGKTVGYENIGQNFSSEQYFWGRPSAVNYNAAGSGGSNKAPSNSGYLATVQSRTNTFIAHHPGVTKAEIPVDLITASGSGLDPHISPQAARIQVKRVAAARALNENIVQALVERHIENPLLNLFGPARVNVLELNIALDELSAGKK